MLNLIRNLLKRHDETKPAFVNPWLCDAMLIGALVPPVILVISKLF